AIKNALLSGPVTATLTTNPAIMAGAHPDGQVRMYAPNPVQLGSSVSHFDDTASPDILMEPAINSGLHDTVDLTHPLFVDLGWLADVTAVASTPSSPGFRVRSAPNPFDPSTVISLSLPNSGATRVEVYDIQGRLVKRLVNVWLPAGNHAVTWDGTNDQGRPVGSGVYFSRIESNGLKTGQRLVKLND
ncbi:MAG TPA: FlgD immunoglobulin-like domain containing protein, partial [Candidatus Eisenbacteria bacterium]|nr:FlgD immunoglobulin-like domain containing protein [Candidatus Eisenbacteria bacterium]